MYIVRESFTARPGMASKLARLIKDVSKDMMKNKVRVMTDVIGDFNTVVFETEIKDLAEHEQMMKEYGEKPELRQRLAGYTDLWITGKREIFRVVE
ncbi:MAG: hypothetical protein AAB290_02870 [Candidatus Eisenbacteria bacterium]|jgi:hypothetical protein